MNPPIYDVHAHFLTPEYTALLERHHAALEDGFPLPDYQLEQHLQLMERCHIAWSLLSVSTPQPYFPDAAAESIALCRRLNEQMAAIRDAHPKQFGFHACLPLPNLDAALEEAVYALDVLHADGVKFASNSRGLYLGDPQLEPLMAELNKRHAICNLHPHRPEPIKEGIFSAGPAPLFEFLADTTRAVLNLISNGVVLRYPEITWIVPHCGSFLPNLYDRFVGISKILVPRGMMQDVDIPASFRRLYFDLSGNPAPHLLNWLLTITTPDHILYGSDFPFTPPEQIVHNLDALLAMLDQPQFAAAKPQILSQNAKALYRLS